MAVDHLNRASPHHGTESWRKLAKRSKRAKIEQTSSSVEEHLATCLLMLAQNGGVPEKSSHTCGVCNKTFSSHQALGGHKASHRAKPQNGAVEESKTKNDASALNPRGKLHECSICHKSFATGQALGGHKRKHYEGVIGGVKFNGATSSVSGVTASEDGAVSYSDGDKIVRDFDLNLPPSDEVNLTLGF